MKRLAGRKKIELMDFLEIPFTLLRIIGIRLIRTGEVRPFLEKVAFVVAFSNMGVHVILKILYPYMEQFENTVEVTEFGIYSAYTANSVGKFMVLWNGRYVLEEVLVELEKIFPKTDKEATVYRVKEIYKNLHMSIKSMMIFYLFTSAMFNFFPFVQSILEYKVSGGNFRRRLPYFFYYPFDEYNLKIYPFVYLYQVMSSCITLGFYLSTDLILVALTNLTSMHFEYLGRRITNFEPTGTDEDLKELSQFIQYHCNILDISRKINEIFNLAILLNFLASCFALCMLGFQISIGPNILDWLKFGGFFIGSLGHIYFICHFGSKLLTKSSDLSDAVFSHRWYLGNNKYKKMLVLIIARTHKPAQLMAFKFFVLSMESFQAWITMAYQFFTLIKTTYSQ